MLWLYFPNKVGWALCLLSTSGCSGLEAEDSLLRRKPFSVFRVMGTKRQREKEMVGRDRQKERGPFVNISAKKSQKVDQTNLPHKHRMQEKQ